MPYTRVLPSLLLALTPTAALALNTPDLPTYAQRARPDTLPAIRLTLYWENDGGFAKPYGRQDRHYTSGSGVSLAWRAPWVDALLAPVPSIFNEFNTPGTTYAMGFVGALTIYTPDDIGRRDLIPDERPYAGWTYGGLFFQRANHIAPRDFFRTPGDPIGAYESLEIDAGIVGPSSLAQNAQEMVHHFYDYVYPRGWQYQLNDEPHFSLKYDRRWLLNLPIPFSNETYPLQVLPEIGLITGTLQNELHAGLTFRAGFNLPDDFGPGELARPADFTSHAQPSSLHPFEHFFTHQTFYIFARPYGRLVAHNVLLQGNNFSDRDPITVTPEPALFAFQVGLVHRFFTYFELGYMTTWQTPEFRGQGGWDSWSSVQLSFSCTF